MGILEKNQIKNLVEKVQANQNYKRLLGFGIARVELNSKKNKTLQATFATVNWKENYKIATILIAVLLKNNPNIDSISSELICAISKKILDDALKFTSSYAELKKDKNITALEHIRSSYEESSNNIYKIIFIFKDTKPKSVECVYFKLYLLSLAKVKLKSINLDDIFSILENTAWVKNKPIDLQWLRENEIKLKIEGKYPPIDAIDKLPRFTHHILPKENSVRILDSSRVRLGASIAPGTTVMPGASYINFNAGTEGACMVEGRISSSAVVGENSDIGGGASILGVLSGTNANPISVGKNVLLGANSVTGIPLGDGCIVDAGVAILEGTKINISAEEFEKLKIVNNDQIVITKKVKPNRDGSYNFKALDLAHINGAHFRQDSMTGKIVAFRSKREINLNDKLHR